MATDDITEILQAIRTLDDKLSVVTNTLTGAIDHDRPGLIERVRKLEEWVSTERRIVYSIGMLLVADMVMKIWGLITGTP